MTEDNDKNKPSFMSVLLSTLAAAIGVQSNKNRERDFKHGNVTTYIIAGLVFTALFVFTVAMVVKAVLDSSGL